MIYNTFSMGHFSFFNLNFFILLCTINRRGRIHRDVKMCNHTSPPFLSIVLCEVNLN